MRMITLAGRWRSLVGEYAYLSCQNVIRAVSLIRGKNCANDAAAWEKNKYSYRNPLIYTQVELTCCALVYHISKALRLNIWRVIKYKTSEGRQQWLGRAEVGCGLVLYLTPSVLQVQNIIFFA